MDAVDTLESYFFTLVDRIIRLRQALASNMNTLEVASSAPSITSKSFLDTSKREFSGKVERKIDYMCSALSRNLRFL